MEGAVNRRGDSRSLCLFLRHQRFSLNPLVPVLYKHEYYVLLVVHVNLIRNFRPEDAGSNLLRHAGKHVTLLLLLCDDLSTVDC